MKACWAGAILIFQPLFKDYIETRCQRELPYSRTGGTILYTLFLIECFIAFRSRSTKKPSIVLLYFSIVA